MLFEIATFYQIASCRKDQTMKDLHSKATSHKEAHKPSNTKNIDLHDRQHALRPFAREPYRRPNNLKIQAGDEKTLSKEENAQLALRQEKFIHNLYNALKRIDNKTYGVCRVTGKLIQKERLRLVPHATLSIEAKRSQ